MTGTALQDGKSTGKSNITKCREFFGVNKSAKAWFIDNHLLAFLFLAFLVGLVFPKPGEVVSEPVIEMGDDLGSMRMIQFINVAIVFLISGFRMKTDAVLKAFKQPMALLCGWFSILLWTPLFSLVAIHLPLGQKEFSYGLAVFACVPTTLTSGAGLIAGCEGANRASELALMLAISTNLLGCLTTPLVLSMSLSTLDVEFDVLALLVKLILNLLVPVAIGKVAQVIIPGAAKFSKNWKTTLTILSNFNLVFVVWQSVSRSKETIASAGAQNIIVCVLSCIGLHLVFWIMNAPIYAVPKIPDVHQRRAVFLLGSQKTLPVGLAIIAGLPADSLGNVDLMLLPCIFGHLSQLVIDAFLVDYWAKLPETSGDSKADPPPKVADSKDTDNLNTEPAANVAGAETAEEDGYDA